MIQVCACDYDTRLCMQVEFVYPQSYGGVVIIIDYFIKKNEFVLTSLFQNWNDKKLVLNFGILSMYNFKRMAHNLNVKPTLPVLR